MIICERKSRLSIWVVGSATSKMFRHVSVCFCMGLPYRGAIQCGGVYGGGVYCVDLNRNKYKLHKSFLIVYLFCLNFGSNYPHGDHGLKQGLKAVLTLSLGQG
jgi:hypothetical protein